MKQFGNNFLIFLLTLISLNSCSSKKYLLKVSEDSYRYLTVPELGLTMAYYGDYAFTNQISSHEKKDILNILGKAIPLKEINKGVFVYKAYTTNSPFLKSIYLNLILFLRFHLQ